MERAAARSGPSSKMLEWGRVLIADGFFFIAERLPRKTRGGKSREQIVGNKYAKKRAGTGRPFAFYGDDF